LSPVNSCALETSSSSSANVVRMRHFSLILAHYFNHRLMSIAMPWRLQAGAATPPTSRRGRCCLAERWGHRSSVWGALVCRSASSMCERFKPSSVGPRPCGLTRNRPFQRVGNGIGTTLGAEAAFWGADEAAAKPSSTNVLPMNQRNRTRTFVVERKPKYRILSGFPGESALLITVWLQVRVLPGPPPLSRGREFDTCPGRLTND
jgi:hypothetical protein